MDACQRGLGLLEKEAMDWSHLNYEATAVRSALVLAGNDPYKIQELFEAAKATGDAYKLRAWMDTAPATFPEDPKSFGREWEDLKTDILKSKNLVASGEMAKYEAEKNGHLEELAELSRTASVLAEDLAEGVGYLAANVMDRVFGGISTKDGELKVDFYRADETPDQTFTRLETERSEREQVQAEVFEKFGTAYDPLLDGIA
jgi:hypothetical protein